MRNILEELVEKYKAEQRRTMNAAFGMEKMS